ncbi:MAG: hypothetical protein DRP42_01510 [Tenericutes bacterium]|nr:MAG: hypothetical protein DRP42_01510 [Mycoplasmatota bacterium]
MNQVLPNFSRMDKEDGTVYGKVTLTCVNPYNTYFMVKYADGTITRGNNLLKTGWDDIDHGFVELSYHLSTGKVIKLPKFKAYLPLIEASLGMDGSRIFHALNIKCLAETEVVVYRIFLKDEPDSKYGIGDVVISMEPIPKEINKSWKFTG